MSQQQANAEAAIHPLIANRWSPRAFDGNRAVETEKLHACLEAARWSASCYGDQPWRFIVADKSSHPEHWQKLFNCLAEGNKLWAIHAPVLILACASQTFAHNNNPNRWGEYDAGQAMMSFSLQAVAEGLICHPMGGFVPDMAREAFAIADGFTLMSVTALGYQGAAESLPEQYNMVETATRTRKPLSEIAFTAWNEPWQTQENS